MPLQALAGVQQALHGAGAALSEAAGSLVSSIVAELVQQCSQVLRQLQGIMVTYRSGFCSHIAPLCSDPLGKAGYFILCLAAIGYA